MQSLPLDKAPAPVIAWLMGSIFLAPMAMDALFGIALLYLVMQLPHLRRWGSKLARDGLCRCIIALLVLQALSVAWSPEPGVTDFVQVWLRTIFCACFLLITSELLVEQPGFEMRLYRAITLGALVGAVICIALYYYSPPADGRLTGLFRFNNAGRAGRIFCVALPFLLAGLVLDRKCWRWLAGIALAVTIAALLLTDTRRAWLGGAISLLAYGVATRETRQTRFLAIMAACCAFALALALVAIYHPNPAVTDALLPRGDSFRLGIWSAHLRELVSGTPLFGRGVLTQQWAEVGEHSFRGAHNLYISVAEHIGIPGLLLFLTAMIWTGKRLVGQLHIPVARLGLSLLLGGSAIFIFSGDRLIDKVNFIWFVFWFPVAIALSIDQIAAARAGSTAPTPATAAPGAG